MTQPAVTEAQQRGSTGRRARFCPGCGLGLEDRRGFLQEFWAAETVNFFCWCPRCGDSCVVTYADTVISYEPEH